MKKNYNINITSLSIIKLIFWVMFAYAAYLLKDFLYESGEIKLGKKYNI